MKTKSFIARRAFIGRLRPFISRAAAFIARRAICLLALLLATAPAFADAPQDTDLLYVCAGKGYKLTSVRKAEGSALTYTWYVIKNNDAPSSITNSNAASITVTADNNNTAGTYAYVRTVKGENCEKELPSNTYTIVVLKPEAPVINVLPSSASVCEGNAVVFGILPADNTTYTWTTVQGNADANNGSSNSSYTIGSSATYGTKQVQASASVTYDIDNSETKVCVSTLSEIATAVVQPLPVITDNTTADACGSGPKDLKVEIKVAAETPSEEAVSIQWYSDTEGNNTIEGATSSSYTTESLTKTKTYYVGATVTATQCKSDGLTEVTATIHVDEGKITASEEEEG